MGLFTRRRKQATDTGGLGVTLIALRLDEGDVAPVHSTVVVFNAAGYARRAAAGKVSCEQGESVFCFHPGPYSMDLLPFAAAPEWGLRLRFVIDAANPRVTQQRFDLYLYSETAGRLALADFGAAVEMALRAELAQGALELPPCTSLEEWHAFRAGLNQLMYTRYGVTVDDCVPVDLGEQVDFAAILKARAPAKARTLASESLPASAPAPAAATHTLSALPTPADERQPPPATGPALPPATAPATAPASPSAATSPRPIAASSSPAAASRGSPSTAPSAAALPPPAAAPHALRGSPPAAPSAAVSSQPAAGSPPMATAQQDVRALRRLFLELPALSGELRLLVLPAGLPIFQQHQALLLRLGMAILNVNTMPALAWAAPDHPLAPEAQTRRTAQTLTAQAALDEAWSLLARLQLADPQQWPHLLDEADRICANLETGLSLRRVPYPPKTEPSL